MKDLKTLIDSAAIYHETLHIYRAQLMFQTSGSSHTIC